MYSVSLKQWKLIGVEIVFLLFIFLIPATEVLAAACPATNFCRSACSTGETSTADTCASGQTCCAPAAPAGGGATTQITFTNPLQFDTVEGLLTNVMGVIQNIIVVLALVFIVIGAILYITSAGDEGRMKTAKGAILAAMIGLAIALAAPSFLKEIGTVLGWGPVNDGVVAGALTLSQIASKVLAFLLSIVGVLGVIMLVIGGLVYLTAAGDENRIDTGKKIVLYSIIGITVAMAALVLVTQIATFFE